MRYNYKAIESGEHQGKWMILDAMPKHERYREFAIVRTETEARACVLLLNGPRKSAPPVGFEDEGPTEIMEITADLFPTAPIRPATAAPKVGRSHTSVVSEVRRSSDF